MANLAIYHCCALKADDCSQLSPDLAARCLSVPSKKACLFPKDTAPSSENSLADSRRRLGDAYLAVDGPGAESFAVHGAGVHHAGPAGGIAAGIGGTVRPRPVHAGLALVDCPPSASDW